MKKVKYIDFNTTYNLPECISVVNHNGKYIIISINTARWLILNNSKELEFYKLLYSNSISEALKQTKDNVAAKNVILQIEAKKFCETNVVSCAQSAHENLHFYLTNACNLRCPHCYMYAGSANQNELTTKEIKDSLTDFYNNEGKRVTFSGGEVCTRSDFVEIIKHAKKVGLKTRVLTNGTLWNEMLVAAVSHYIDSVQISIDGYSEETNSRIRGRGAFEKSLKAMFLFLSSNIRTEIAITPFTITDCDNYEEEINNYVKFAKHLSKITDNKIHIRFAEEIIEGRNVCLNNEKKDKHTKYIHAIQSKFYNYDSEELSFVKSFNNNIIKDNCMYGSISIDSCGNVCFCARVTDLQPVGNIKSINFKEIMKIAQKAHDKSNINNLPICNVCDLKYICGGGCRIDRFPQIFNKIKNEQTNFCCSKEYKNFFYDIMIRTNNKFFQ